MTRSNRTWDLYSIVLPPPIVLLKPISLVKLLALLLVPRVM